MPSYQWESCSCETVEMANTVPHDVYALLDSDWALHQEKQHFNFFATEKLEATF